MTYGVNEHKLTNNNETQINNKAAAVVELIVTA